MTIDHPGPTWVIVNPAAGNGKAAQHWPHLATQLTAQGITFTQAITCGPGDGIMLAAQAVAARATRLIVVGGDGTLNEIVTGLSQAITLGTAVPTLALLPLGTGTDFARGLGITSIEAGLNALHNDQPQAIDLGIAQFHDQAGQAQRRAFVNVADCGLGPHATAQIRNVSQLPGQLAYLYGATQAIAAYTPAMTQINVDGQEAYHAPCGLLAVGNGRYFGGGMHVAPKAQLADGQFDLVILGGTNRRRLLSELLPRVYRGTHLRHPAVHLLRGATIAITAEPPLPLELDGEIVGSTPATFSLLPQALNVFAPTAHRPLAQRGSAPATQPRQNSH